LGRVYLAGHDRGTGLQFRQPQFADSATRTGREQAQVGGHLLDRHCAGAHQARNLDQRIDILGGIDQVAR
jgi:hypothetical protein